MPRPGGGASIGNQETVAYYGRRAHEYERIYEKPERQADLTALKSLLRGLLAGRDVLEIACGTGYWTQVVAEAARSIVATDAGAEVLEMARAKSYPAGRVRFEQADAYGLDGVGGKYDAVLVAFFWSHIPRQRFAGFLDGLYRRLGSGARMVFVDNRYVEGSSTPISRTDAVGNTYQERQLEDGSRHEVRKNFPAAAELRAALSPYARAVALTELPYYWCAWFDAKDAGARSP